MMIVLFDAEYPSPLLNEHRRGKSGIGIGTLTPQDKFRGGEFRKCDVNIAARLIAGELNVRDNDPNKADHMVEGPGLRTRDLVKDR